MNCPVHVCKYHCIYRHFPRIEMNGMIIRLKSDLEEEFLHYISGTRSLYGVFKLLPAVSYVKCIAATHEFICAITIKIDRKFFLEVFQFPNLQLNLTI